LLPNDSDLEYTLISLPLKGNIQLNPDGSFTYTPPTEFCGEISFGYQVCNTNSNCCEQGTGIIKVTQNCPEICGNEIDDDGDGEIDYQEEDCQGIEDGWPQVYVPASTWLCDSTGYIFDVEFALPGFNYSCSIYST